VEKQSKRAVHQNKTTKKKTEDKKKGNTAMIKRINFLMFSVNEKRE
jgi:hypothetical protein